MKSRYLHILILVLFIGCSANENCMLVDNELNKPPVTSQDTIDSMKDQGIYWTLPLGMTLDQYKALYKLENYRSETPQSKVDYVDFDCAIISSPTMEEVDDMDPESISISRKYLETVASMIQSCGIRTINTTERYINLKGDLGAWELDLKKNSFSPYLKKNSLPLDLKMYSLPEGKVILFKVTKEPIVLPDVLATADDVETYFEISK